MLAIVIPYFKLTFFEETLQSLSNQTDKRFKVYIGNDASTEDPSFLLEKYKYKIDFKYQKFDSNLGSVSLVKQWDRCIEMIGDEQWIMILGDDDYLDINVVESWYNCYDKFNLKSNLIRFSTKCVENNIISAPFLHPEWETATDFFYRKFKKLTRSSLSEHIFRRSSYLKYGFKDYPLGWFSDYKAWLDFPDGLPIYSINNTCVYIRESALSITGMSTNGEKKLLAEYLFTYDIYSNYLIYFNKTKKNEFLYRFEEVIKKSRKLENAEWFKLFILYSKNFKLKHWIRFVRRYVINIIKN